MTYSLANYTLVIIPEDTSLITIFGKNGAGIAIGGQGNAVGSVSAEHTQDLWSTTAFETGAWVHNKNCSKVGTINLSVSQLVEEISLFKKLCEEWRRSDCLGLTMSLTNGAETIWKATDCYITREPAQEFGPQAGTQQWSFTCGVLTFN